MKKFFYVVVAVAVLFAAKSCKEPEPEPTPVVIPTEDSSGFCTVIFQNMEGNEYNIYIDNVSVKQSMMGTFSKSGVQAGTRTLYAEQVSGVVPPASSKTKTTVVKILTDSVYIWQFP